MKKLGWFKKAGLVFVKGDHTIESRCFNFNTDLNFNKYNHFDSSPILEFAWRENTGVKPEFNGVIEFTFNGEGCEMQEVRLAENVNWEMVKKWRPSLNQPQQWPDNSRMEIIGQNGNDGLHYDNTAQQVEALAVNHKLLHPRNPEPIFKSNEEAQKSLNEHLAKLADSKPIFTKAMADAGEKVKVGMEFSTATGNHVALLVNEDSVVFLHKELGFIVENHLFVHPINNISQREKKIDSVMLQIGCHPSQEFIPGAPLVIGKLYDAKLLSE